MIILICFFQDKIIIFRIVQVIFGQTLSEEVVKAPLKLTYPEGWIGQSLISDIVAPIAGNSFCVKALNKPEYW